MPSRPRLFPRHTQCRGASRSALGAVMLAGITAACAQTAPAPRLMPASASRGAAIPVTSVVLDHAQELRATLKVPSRAPYVMEAMGIGGQTVALRLTNTSRASVPVAPVLIWFTVTREGVSFPCEAPPVPKRIREPTSLGPGESFDFERELDCAMPLPGEYRVTVFAALRASRTSAGEGDVAGSFALQVTANRRSPRPYPGHPGLFFAMTGSRATRPLPPEAWARGDYAMVIAAVNASQRRIPLGPARLAFLTYRAGSPLPCSGQAETVNFPDELAPGETYVARAPVACAPSAEGRYEIVGRLSIGGQDAVDVGRVSLRVTRDSLLFSPEPWPAAFGDRPGGSASFE